MSAKRLPFAARRFAVAPAGRLIAVAGDGEVAVLDHDLADPRWSRATIDSPNRIAVDDDGVVVLSSADAGCVCRVTEHDSDSIEVPEGFHESLVLVPGVGAHICISGATSLSAVAAFGTGLVTIDEAVPQGALRLGARLGIFSTELLRVFDVDASGSATLVRDYQLDGVERIVADSAGTEVLTVAATWDGSTDVLRLERIELDSDKRSEVSAEIGRNDALAISGASVVRAFGANKPARLTTVVGDSTFEIDVDAAVAAERR
jgi:hypothetical protein